MLFDTVPTKLKFSLAINLTKENEKVQFRQVAQKQNYWIEMKHRRN